MNYWLHYNRLMQRARDRIISGYIERHHIIPRCVGGLNADNVVSLTPEEHYVAHQLLVKIYPHSHGLVVAASRMAKQSSGRKAFGWLRRRLAESMRGNMLGSRQSEESKEKRRLKMIGHSVSAETRKKISAAKTGMKYRLSVESREKMARLARENKPSLGNRSRLGRPHTLATRLKISLSHKARLNV